MNAVLSLPLASSWATLTEDDLAAIQDTYHLVPRRFIVVYLEQLCPSAQPRLKLTLLGEA